MVVAAVWEAVWALRYWGGAGESMGDITPTPLAAALAAALVLAREDVEVNRGIAETGMKPGII